MTTDITPVSKPMADDPALSAWKMFAPFQEYWIDAWQRSILCLDTLRERGNTFWERSADPIPHVLKFKAELVRDGRTLPERPVNYLLVHIVPPEGVKIDPAKRPFIVVDPRAGHGPGIGGMKQDSEIGEALAEGHPCYFIGFLPTPVPGQTIEDVWRAEAIFVQDVAARHPDAEGKPVIIANCQAGWQTMIMAAVNPDLAGPIMLAGSPLSYWAGVPGKNPMRYTGGVLGGTWLTSLAGDLGGGIFDGANLVANFESLNPANTYWEKPYGAYSKIDTEATRFLDFETWWGNPVLLNASEMQWIADNLFVGNKLTSGALHTSDGVRIDLRNIKSPIIVFCSWGDNITPPQQALGWITDIYSTERQIIESGQTIVYTLHQTIGHLGIFVSGKVATKEHSEFTSCMDMIDLMPPGLYEAVITEVDPDTPHPELIEGKYLFTLEARTLDDIRALGGNSAEDEQRFATVARVSEVNQALYRTLVSPVVRAATTPATAEATRQMHPNRLRFGLFSDRNPMMQSVETLAKGVREARKPAAPDNPFVAWEAAASSWISTCLDAYGNARDAMTEAMFMGLYGSPVVQAAVGLGHQEPLAGRRIERDPLREAEVAQMRLKLETRFEAGDPLDAALRALIYVNRPEGSVDEENFAVLKKYREAQPAAERRAMGELKQVMKEQSLLVRLDEERAIQAIPKLLPKNVDKRRASLAAVHRVVEARGDLPEESQRRLERIDSLFA
jgi:hypothetical protein